MLKAFEHLRRGELATITGRTPRAWQLQGPEVGTCTYFVFEVRPSATRAWREHAEKAGATVNEKVIKRQLRAATAAKAFRKKAQEQAVARAQEEALLEAYREEQAKPLEQRRTEKQATYDAIREHLLVSVVECVGAAEEDDIAPLIERYGEVEDEDLPAVEREIEAALAPASLYAPSAVEPLSSRQLSDAEVEELLRARFVDDIDDPDVEPAPRGWPLAGFTFGGRGPATPDSPCRPVCDLIATIVRDLANLATEGHRWEQRQALDAAKKASTGGLDADPPTPTEGRQIRGSSRRGSASTPDAPSPSTGPRNAAPVSDSTTAGPAPSALN